MIYLVVACIILSNAGSFMLGCAVAASSRSAKAALLADDLEQGRRITR